MQVNDEERKWNGFLDSIATRVDELIIDPANLKVFREKIAPFAERWKRHVADSRRASERRVKHWERVKANPRLQDKNAGPPKEGWEWDKGWYLTGLPTHHIGPEYAIPAKYVPDVIAAVEGRIEQNRREMGRYAESSQEYQQFAKSIPVLEGDLVELRREFDRLTPAEKKGAWIKAPCRSARTPNRVVTGFQWWRWLDITEEDVFGCWRPPLKDVPEHPCKRLIPEQDTLKLPRPRDKTEEYERYYVCLTSIHDNWLAGSESIREGVWPHELAESVWLRFSKARPWGPDQAFIETALKRVQAQLKAKTPRRQGGRKPKHEAELWQLVQNTYDDLCEKGMDSKGAWNKAAETHGMKSGDAARMGCYRYLQHKRNTEQN